jgi:hypothetical protein
LHLTTEELSCHKVSISFDLAWAYRLSKNPDSNFTERLDFSGNDFSINGLNNSRNSVDGAFTITGEICDNWQLFAEAAGTYCKKTSTYNILGGIQYTW